MLGTLGDHTALRFGLTIALAGALACAGAAAQ